MKNKKNIFIFLLSFFVLLSIFSFKNIFANDSVKVANFLAEKNIIVDKKNNPSEYRLKSNILRQEIAWIIAKVAEVPEKQDCENLFWDMTKTKPNSWVCARVEALLDAWIIAKNKYYRPEEFVSKAEAVWFILKSLYSEDYNKSYDKNYSWEENAISFAEDIEILKEEVSDYSQKASREFIFKIIYNALINDSEVSSSETQEIPKNTEKNIANIAWESCKKEKFSSWFSDEITPNLECAIFKVPLDYSKPNGKKFDLALTRLKAKNKQNLWDLLIVSGWPWQSSHNTIFEGSFDKYPKIIQNFNIIWYAPRWVFPSNPQIDCWNVWDENYKDIMQKCIKNSWLDFLKNIWTKSALEDIESIRIWLWGNNFSALAYSYGTKVLALYQEKYPKNLRAWVFDWVVDLNEDMFTMLKNQEKWFQKAFENFVDYCVDYENCIFDEEKWNYDSQFHKFLKNIEAKKLKDKNWNIISWDSVLKIVQDKLLWDSYWNDIISLTFDLNKGKTNSYNEFAEDIWDNSWDDSNNTDILTDMSLEVINCADFAPKKSTRNEKNYIEESKKVDNFSPYDNYKQKSDKDYLDLCFYWPFDGTDEVKVSKNNTWKQMLFVAQLFDPTTPYENAVNMAKYFNSPLVTRNQNGHTISFTEESSCVDEKVISYLLNPEKKLENTICEK